MDKLTGLEALRKRPAMFVGDTTVRGLHHLFNELLDNSIDQFLANQVTTVTAAVSDSTLEFADDGPGLPFDDPGFKSESLAGDYLTHLRSGAPTADGHTPHDRQRVAANGRIAGKIVSSRLKSLVRRTAAAGVDDVAILADRFGSGADKKMKRFELPLPAAPHDDNCWQCPEMFFGTNRQVKDRCRRFFRRVTVDTLDELSITKAPTQSLYRPVRPIIVSESVSHSCAKLEAWKLCYLWESVTLEWSNRPDRGELYFRLFELLSRELWFCVAMMSKDFPIPPWADLGSWSSFESLRRSAAKAIVDWLPEIYRIAHLIINLEPEITSMMWKLPGFRFTWSDGLLGLLSDIGHQVQIQIEKEDETWDLFAELCRSGMIRIENERCVLTV